MTESSLQSPKETWASYLLTGSNKKISSLLLCHHSTDESRVLKFKESIEDLLSITVIPKDEHKNDVKGFDGGVIIFCLSTVYASISGQFEKDLDLPQIFENDLVYVLIDNEYNDIRKYLSPRAILREDLLYFDDVETPSIYKVHRKTKGQSNERRKIYISSHKDVAKHVAAISEIVQSFQGVACKKTPKRSLSGWTTEDWEIATNELLTATEYLIILTQNYFEDIFCCMESDLIRQKEKNIHIIQVDNPTIPSEFAWLNQIRMFPYDEDLNVMRILVSYILEDIPENKKILIIFHPCDKEFAENHCKTMQRELPQFKICLTSTFPDTKTMFKEIKNSEAVVICLSKTFMNDASCRKETEFANLIWKKIIPVTVNADMDPNQRPEWLVKIIGCHQHVNQSEVASIVHHNTVNKNNLALERWIRRNITIPVHSELSIQIAKSRDGTVNHMMTDAYGEVEVFSEGGMERYTAKYVRLSTLTDLQTVASLIIEHWKLHQPRLLISITGEGVKIINNPSKTRMITSALQNIVKERGIWFTTDGADSEISKVIGQVVEREDINYRPTVIGIASWEYLKMNSNLVSKHGFGKWPATYDTRDAMKAPGDYFLNPFCSHFLLPDKCVEFADKKDVPNIVSTARFRIAFEEFIRQGKYHKENKADTSEVPVLLLVVGGDPLQSLSMVRRSLDVKRPVIVLVGSGGFADSLYESSNHLKIVQEKKVLEILNHSNRSYLHFVDLNDETSELDMIILDILLSGISDYESKLRMALAFNSSEKAMEHVFSRKDKDLHLTEEFTNTLMIKAMREGKKEFVKLLIKDCIDIYKFQLENHERLYRVEYLPDELRRQLGWNVNPTVQNIRSFVVRYVNLDVFVDYNIDMDITDIQVDPYFNLLIWSILMMNLQDLSRFFWQHCKEPIPSALIASCLLRKLGQKCLHSNRLLAEKLFRAEQEFGNLARGVLEQFFEENPEETEKMLMRKRRRWRNLSCLQIAFVVKHKHFMSHEACKMPINNTWFGRISPNTSALRMIISVFFLGIFPCVIPFTSRGYEDKKNQQIKDQNSSCCSVLLRRVGRRIKDFYTAPVMRFAHTMASYLLFLALFSYALLVRFTETITWVEILLYCWIFTLLLEEFREMFIGVKHEKNHYGDKYKKERPSLLSIYFRDKWNYFDITTLGFFVIGVVCNSQSSYWSREVARVFLAISLIAFFMRILKTFSALEELGPKVLMIASMAKDLLYFVVVLMVFIVSYAVAAYAIMYPHSEFSFDLILNVLRLGYWNLYGELLLDEIEAEEPTCTFDASVYSAGTLPRCAVKHRRVLGLIMMGVYLIFANVMLLNILIAMFMDTYQRVQTKRDQNWNYERYALIKEFKSSPIVPMPLGAPIYLFYFVRWIYRKCKKCKSVDTQQVYNIKLLESQMLVALEREIVYMYMKKRREGLKETSNIEEKIMKLVATQIERRISRLQSTPENGNLSGNNVKDISDSVIKEIMRKDPH